MQFWDQYPSWEKAEAAWDAGIVQASKKSPLKALKVLPQIPGITDVTARNLKWKSLKYMVTHDNGGKIRRHVLKHPFRYLYNYLKSILKKQPYIRQEDFFLYGFPSIEAFEGEACKEDSLLVVGFSYCQKPHECPSGRFNDQCIRDSDHPICRQCPIGKVLNALPNKRTLPLIIPTVHYIGDKMFELVHAHPDKQVLFLITACEMTLEMFGDWGNMAGIRGIGVRLDGRICNTLRAFELSEEGIKPGLTIVTPKTQGRILDLMRRMRETSC
jgi:hypothetical protein